ncbi:MAG: alpha/beta fold hydrolase, partial [Vicinamibacterales bacterium]
LLNEHAVPAPFVLVGHSTGGLIVRLYANSHPGEVAGLVLVDSSHEDQFERFAIMMAGGARGTYLDHEWGRNLERLNVVESGNQVRGARDLPAVPLFVLSSAWGEISATVHRELQADLARLRPDARHRLVETGHFIQNEAPAVVVDAIREVVHDAQRTSGQQAQ